MVAVAFNLPPLQNAWTILRATSSPLSSPSITATAVGPAPLMVQPSAPASRAAALTAAMPGMRGALVGSTMPSEDIAEPMTPASPCSTAATSAAAWLELRTCCWTATCLGSAARILLVGASKSGVTRTKWRRRQGGEESGMKWKGS
uniref:Uncharacterized protein n=1 Tax=Arundo donax TaxID=35708 RepID=A0A0A9F4I3_ARUDO